MIINASSDAMPLNAKQPNDLQSCISLSACLARDIWPSTRHKGAGPLLLTPFLFDGKSSSWPLAPSGVYVAFFRPRRANPYPRNPVTVGRTGDGPRGEESESRHLGSLGEDTDLLIGHPAKVRRRFGLGRHLGPLWQSG